MTFENILSRQTFLLEKVTFFLLTNKKDKRYQEIVAELLQNYYEMGADDKAASAKTITLKSTSRPNSTASTEKAEGTPEPEVNGEPEATAATETTEEIDEIGDGEDVQKAAVKIQAVFRGHQTRKTMKQSDKPAATPEPEPTREELEAEFRADDQELCHAATKIQASFRGHMARKVKDEKDGEGNGEGATANPDAEEELDIDLTDPELSKAAVKIQASFRGHMARKDVDGPK